MGRDPRTASRGSSFAALASWTPDRGLLGLVAGYGSKRAEGVARVLAGLAAQT